MHRKMRRRWLWTLSSIVIVLTIAGMVALRATILAQDQATPNNRVQKSDAQQFVELLTAAFNQHDAKRVAEMFLPEGELVDQNGNVLRSRGAIESHYTSIFKTHPQSQLSVTNETLRQLGDSLAMYDGIADVKFSTQDPRRRTRFAAVLSRQGNQWQVASIRDLEELENDPAVIRETLKALEFLVGEWLEEGGDFRIHTSCQWSDDKLSLIKTFHISGTNIKEMKGTQRIAWDPATQKIKSWTHDTQGGYAEALWTSKGGSWIVKSTGTNSDGDATSMTSEYRHAGKGRIDIFFRDRINGDEVLADAAVTMVHKPPAPKP